jgi:hypothetical protein
METTPDTQRPSFHETLSNYVSRVGGFVHTPGEPPRRRQCGGGLTGDHQQRTEDGF